MANKNENENEHNTVRILCPKLVISSLNQYSVQWLIGSPFLPRFTVVSTVNAVHSDRREESEALRSLITRGFGVIGALIVASSDAEESPAKAIEEARNLRKILYGGDEFCGCEVIGAVANSGFDDVLFFASKSASSASLDRISSVVYENFPEKFIWERGCLLRCEVPISIPIHYPVDKPSDAEKKFEHAIEACIDKLQDPKTVYVVKTFGEMSDEILPPVMLRAVNLDFSTKITNTMQSKEISQDINDTNLLCKQYCSNESSGSRVYCVESAGKIHVSVHINASVNSSKPASPVAEYFPVLEETRRLVVEFKLEVLGYAAKDFPVRLAVPKLIVPGLVDQLNIMKNAILPTLLAQRSELQLQSYHFTPPGFLHPINVIYELDYGETELKQVEVRKSLHSRLGLPLDRPLLRIANALNFLTADGGRNTQKGSNFLKDVHIGIPSSGVSGGAASIVQGSYEYYHYMHNSFNDSGWGCAYRSLQTIISWFRLQHYTSMEVPSHRGVQQALVEIGDKDPSFVGSREWIGAIELGFVLDKLLGVSCKVLNVRSGAELPEKCRELALHFENQGTPIMIGGGVLAYTLLGVDYNDATGDCAFLILDPHYTGNDEHKKIVNGGWCGWKKAVDSKGKHFFLHDKFYNLLLPQRPNMV